MPVGSYFARVAASRSSGGVGGSDGGRMAAMALARSLSGTGRRPTTSVSRALSKSSFVSAHDGTPPSSCGDVEALLEVVLDHPAAEPDGRLGDDEHFLLAEDVHVVFHLRRERVRADAESAAQRQRVERHADVLVDHPPVHHRAQLAVYLRDEHVLVLHAVRVERQQFGVDARGDDVVEVALDPDERRHVGQDRRDLVARHLPDDHLLPARDRHVLRREGRHRVVYGTQYLLKVNGHVCLRVYRSVSAAGVDGASGSSTTSGFAGSAAHSWSDAMYTATSVKPSLVIMNALADAATPAPQ